MSILDDKIERYLNEGKINYRKYLSLKNFTTFHIGGACKFVCFPNTYEEVCYIQHIRNYYDVPLRAMSGGSNLLIEDGVLEGVTIIFAGNFSNYSVNGNVIEVQSGVSCGKVVAESVRLGLGGFEKFVGVPSRIGGMVAMNFGANGSEIFDMIDSVYLARGGEVIALNRRACQFGYRDGGFRREDIILGCKLRLKYVDGGKEYLSRELRKNIEKRRSTQPLGTYNCGCVFKNSGGVSSSWLIDKCGLKGTRVGDAMVSTKHGGFIINLGEASCKDVKFLIDILKKKVYNISTIIMQPELQFFD